MEALRRRSSLLEPSEAEVTWAEAGTAATEEEEEEEVASAEEETEASRIYSASVRSLT